MLLKYAEFYMTNVCNFNCDGCNRFNNLKFSGNQRWVDYKEDYRRWASLVDIERFTMLGGEPMTSPDYLDWLSGLHSFWPRAHGVLLTNAHYLQPDNKKLYDVLANSDGQLSLEIGLHNINRAALVLNTVQQWLQAPTQLKRFPENINDIQGFDFHWKAAYQSIRDQSWPDCDTVEQWANLPVNIQQECAEVHGWSPDLLADKLKDWQLIDSNGVRVVIRHENQFSPASVLIAENQPLRLHKSDVIKAHNSCGFVKNKCYHFVKGKLYKCGPVALFPELDKKFQLDISTSERELINSYQPCAADDADTVRQFLEKIDDPIDQCQFCPESTETQEIFAEHGRKTIAIKKGKANQIGD